MLNKLITEPYAENVITEYGNNTWFLKGSTIWLYIPEIENIPMGNRRLRYREQGVENWTNMAITISPTTHMMAAPDAIKNNAGKYEITTGKIETQDGETIIVPDTDDIAYCNVYVVDVGSYSYSINNDKGIFTLSNFDNCTPIWYQTYEITSEDISLEPYYYMDNNGHRMDIITNIKDGINTIPGCNLVKDNEIIIPIIDNDSSIKIIGEQNTNIDLEKTQWCIRVFYQTGYGYCWLQIYPN